MEQDAMEIPHANTCIQKNTSAMGCNVLVILFSKFNKIWIVAGWKQVIWSDVSLFLSRQ